MPSGACVPISCTDGRKDQDETDVDCGGPTCRGTSLCAYSKACRVSEDCETGYCDNSFKTCGVITVGSAKQLGGYTVDGLGNVYVLENLTGEIDKYSPIAGQTSYVRSTVTSDNGDGGVQYWRPESMPVVVGNNLYWYGTAGIRTIATTASNGASTLFKQVGNPYQYENVSAMFSDGTLLYYSYFASSGAVVYVDPTTGTGADCASGNLYVTKSIAVTTTAVFWTLPGVPQISRAVKNPGGPSCSFGDSLLTKNDGLVDPEGIAADATNIYWVDPGTKKAMQMNNTGGTMIELATAQEGLGDITADGEYVYWTNKLDSNGTVMRTKVATGSPPVVSTPKVMANNLYRPQKVVTGPSYVYWSSVSDDGGGTVFAVRK